MTADTPRQHKILFVANNFPPTRGGSAVVYANLAKHLSDGIIVLAPRYSYSDGLPQIGWREHDRTAPYRVVRKDLLRTQIDSPVDRGFRRVFFILSDLMIRLNLVIAVLQLIALNQVKTVCVGELVASGWLIKFCRFLPSVRSVVYIHGEEITTTDDYDPGRARARGALQAADGIIVVSHFTEGAVREMLGRDAQNHSIQLIENGVDTRRFVPIGRRADLVEFCHLEGKQVFVSVCRLLEKKGIDHAIRAFSLTSSEFPNARYVIVGTGPYEPSLRSLVEELNLQDKVYFAGGVTEQDLVAYYCLGDVFVMPNRKLPNGDTEGFGLVFLEANSCGLPVIAGSDGGSRDAVKHDVNGLVVDGTSVVAIASAMRAFLGDPALLSRLREGGIAISKAADWVHKAEAFRTFCDSL